MDSDHIIDMALSFRDQISLLERELESANQMTARIVAVAGGKIEIPEHMYAKDYVLIRYDRERDHVIVFASKEVTNARKAKRSGA